MSNNSHHKDAIDALIEQYRQSHHCDEWTARDVAIWAINEKLYDVPFASKVAVAAQVFGEHMVKETCLSSRGGRMRKYACVRTKGVVDGKSQSVFVWTDSRYGKFNFMLAAFRRRHRVARADIRALQSDLEEWNACYLPEGCDPITFDWDFTEQHGDEGMSEAS